MTAAANIKVDTNAGALEEAFRVTVRDQLPFATAKALSNTAQSVVKQERRELPRFFKVRTKRTEKSVAMNWAFKRWRLEQIEAQVGVRDDFMVDHATGKTRRPQGAAIAVRTRAIKLTGGGKVPKASQPRQLFARKRVRIDEESGGVRLIAKRAGRGRGRKLKTLYWLRPKVRIRRRWPFRSIAAQEARRRYGIHFTRALDLALRTARPKKQRRNNG